jgi:diguanylate cyclase (GGDEF)-like protein
MAKLRAENISKRLFGAMLVIVLSLLFISVPLIFKSYQHYQQAQLALTEIQSLRTVAELSNKISRERAPSNKVMSSTPEEYAQNREELAEYRRGVDQHIQSTIVQLNATGFYTEASEIATQLQPQLQQGRAAVDAYAALPRTARSMQQLDGAILKMFSAWDGSHNILKNMVIHSQSQDEYTSNYYTLILILADLRDQAGRVASNIIAPVTFEEKMPDTNLARSLQTQHQARYLWDLVYTILPEQDKTPEFIQLHQKVKTDFLDQGIGTVQTLIQNSLAGQAYVLSGTELTKQIVDKFSSVVNLQSYMLDYSLKVAEREKLQAKRQFFLTLFMTSVSLMAALFTMIYARRNVFEPLIKARETILNLSQAQPQPSDRLLQERGVDSLFTAIRKLEGMLQQRDALEFQLKNIANSDALTGVANRLALESYIQHLEQQPKKLEKLGLLVIDIDDFKQVNDQYGHMIGDKVIQMVANILKANVRTTDLIVRYGGDEFLVLLEQITDIDALNIADQIRRDVDSTSMQVGLAQELNVSISAGYAVGAASWLELFHKADQSLFKAKAKGKNAVQG